MKNIRCNALSVILTTMMLASTIVVFRVSAVPWKGYVKPAYPDYAPSGMPDFDEKQDAWGPGLGTYTWCVPVAVANSLWWLDSEYESILSPSPAPPPTISDHFNLVTTYNAQWDDHDSRNVDLFVRNLAFLMDTDGQSSHDGHIGTRWTDIQRGINQYLVQQGVAGLFEVHNSSFPDFAWIDSETEKCQDVELCLEFWQLTGLGWQQTITNPSLEYGHCVTCAGVNATTSQVLISDPWQDAYEAGLVPGRSPVLHAHVPPGNTTTHNDAQYVSQDAYTVVQHVFPMPPPPVPPPGYPQVVWELQGYLQTMGYDPSYHAFIRGAVATSPLGVHDVAVTAVETFKTVCSKYFHPINIVFENYSVSINATVENQGDFEETFDVTAKYDGNVIQTVEVTLADHTSTNVAFTWDTHGVAKGSYTITVEAVLPTDVEPGDNTKTYGPVKVTWLGDLDGDFDIDQFDYWYFCGAFIDYYTPPYVKDPNCDFDNDCDIDQFDYWAFCGAFIDYYTAK